jgi:hypothetical protein
VLPIELRSGRDHVQRLVALHWVYVSFLNRRKVTFYSKCTYYIMIIVLGGSDSEPLKWLCIFSTGLGKLNTYGDSIMLLSCPKCELRFAIMDADPSM